MGRLKTSPATIWRIYQRWRRYLARPEPPCCVCRHLRYDNDASYGVRCDKDSTSGLAGDYERPSGQAADFSCFEQAE